MWWIAKVLLYKSKILFPFSSFFFFFSFFLFFFFSVWSLAQKTWFACDGLFVPHVFQMLSVSKNIYGVFQVVRHSDVTKQGSSES